MLYKLAAAFDKFQPSCWETGGSVADGSEQNLQIVLENLFFFCTDRINGGETPTVFFVRQEFVFPNLENPNKQKEKPADIRGKFFLNFTFSGLLTKPVRGRCYQCCLLRERLADQTVWRRCWNANGGLGINLHSAAAAAAERMILKTSAIFCHRWACNYPQ